MAEKAEKKERPKPKEIDLDSPECHSNITEWVSTGVPTLDLAIGKPGWPVGRSSSLVGNPGVGKSSLIYSTIAGVQARDGIGVLVDSEFSLEKSRAQAVGVDISKLILFQGIQLEDFVPLTEEMIKKRNTGNPDTLLFIAYDTVSALPSESDLAVKPDAMPQPGFHARYLSFAFRRLMSQIARERVALVMVHQPKTKIATMGFGSTLTWIAKIPTTFYSSVIIQLIRYRDVKVGQNPVGIEVVAKVMRSKIAPPLGQAKFIIRFDSGVDGVTPLLELLVLAGKVTKKGGWYTSWDEVKFTANDFRGYYHEHKAEIDLMVNEIIREVKVPDFEEPAVEE
jgi:recombination protein RecA